MSRFACFTRASAVLTSSERTLTLVASSCISWRHFEAASDKDKQLWPWWSSLMHPLQTTWPQASSNERNGSLCFEHNAVAVADSSEMSWWSRVALLRLWKRTASLHISSSQLKHQNIAGCLSSQTSQSNKLSLSSSCWCLTSKMLNNAKFFGNPATPSWDTWLQLCKWGREFYHLQWVTARGSSYKNCDHNSAYEGKDFDHHKPHDTLDTQVLL